MLFNRRQRGFTLLELLIVLAIIGAGLVAQMYRTQLHAREKLGEAQSDILVRIAKAETDYHNKYFSQLTQGQAIAGVADTMNPTVAELQGLGLLDAATSPNNFYGGGYSISLTKAPAACVYPSCFISGLVRLTTPVVNKVTGVVDARALGAAVLKAGGDVGFSDTTTPSLISGEVGGWSLTNPAGAVAGILAMRTGYGSSTFDPNYYLPRDGSKPMFGNLDMGTKNITNVNDVTGTGKGTFNTAQINTDATIGGQATITKLAGKLQINKVAVEGSSCVDASLPYNGNGQLAQDGNGLTLSCQSGVWQKQLKIGVAHYLTNDGFSLMPLGGHRFCSLSGKSGVTGSDCLVYEDAGAWYVKTNLPKVGHWCFASCFN